MDSEGWLTNRALNIGYPWDNDELREGDLLKEVELRDADNMFLHVSWFSHILITFN